MHNPENLEGVRQNEIKHLKETNQIQAMLLMRIFGENGTEKEMEDWIIDNSEKIRALFDSMVEENPAILDDWKDASKRDEILNRIEEGLGLTTTSR